MDQMIKLKDDFDIIDLGDSAAIDEMLNKLQLGSENEIVLDITGCIIDYPCTSKIIDAIFIHFSAMVGCKKLVFVTDCCLPVEVLLALLFLGSTFGQDREGYTCEKNWNNYFYHLLQTYQIEIFLKWFGQSDSESLSLQPPWCVKGMLGVVE